MEPNVQRPFGTNLYAEDFRWWAVPFLLSCLSAWLNTRDWGGWPTGSRGFPFTYETWCDVVPCLTFHAGAALADLMAWTLVVALAVAPAAFRLTFRKPVLLVMFGGLYTWLNTTAWYGETFWSYGFPLSYFSSDLSTEAAQIAFFALAVFTNSAVAVLFLSWITSYEWIVKWSGLVAATVGVVIVGRVLASIW